MLARMRSGFGGVSAVIMMVVALWVWTRAEELSLVLGSGVAHPQLEVWAVRCAALAAAAGAQWLLLHAIVYAIYEERVADEVVRTLVGLLGSLALIAAVVFAWVGR